MSQPVTTFRIFIASPSDCNVERKTVRQIINQDPTIRTLKRELNVALDDLGCEDLLSDLGRPQSIINAAIEKFDPDWIVFIFWHRFGTDAGMGMTGTEEEWNLARKMNEQKSGRPNVSIYFNRAAPSTYIVDLDQQSALENFRSRIFSEHQALASEFNGTSEFEQLFRAHLTKRVFALTNGQLALPKDLTERFLTASRGLLTWQRTLGSGHEIARPELDELLERISGSEQSSTLILGGPGAGKSSLLSAGAHALLEKGMPVLAIKADMLGAGINTFEDLSKWLHINIDLRDAIRILASEEKVVIIIDQLDALSELLDQKSERLNLLLNLIQYLSSIPRVHIVASSREFEFRHDVRLNSISAERMDLKLPDWEKVSPILTESGHSPEEMGESLHDLLRTPWHLKLFIDVAVPGEVFESLQTLLGKLWERQIEDPGGPPDHLILLERLAARMADEESLWLPISSSDNDIKARQALERADILVRGPNDQTIGFRHQTYYDYTMARAFSRGSVSLADHVLSRQNGLFVRPTLLGGLHYIRSTSLHEYHRQLNKLFESNPRPHILGLLIEFLGQQKEPDNEETDIFVTLLASENIGPRILSAIVGNPGWFARLSHTPELKVWLQKPPEKAFYCVPFLSVAIRFSPERTLNMLIEYWTDNPAFDHLTLEVLQNLNEWNLHFANIAAKIIRRSASHSALLLAERIAEKSPELATHVVRAELDRRSEEALRKSEDQSSRKSGLTETEYSSALKRLIEDERDWYNIEKIAAAAPQAFLDLIWPWFLQVVEQISDQEHRFVVGYRDDQVTYKGFKRDFPRSLIVAALLVSVCKLAETDPDCFLSFLEENQNSDFLIVHRLLARGLEKLTNERSDQVLSYLIGDPRRMVLGDFEDNRRETKRLISGVSRSLSPEDRLRLEEHVLQFKPYKEISPLPSPEERFRRLKWVRQDRLRLLRAFNKKHLSPKARRILEKEERALPDTKNYDSHISGGWVGPRISSEKMSRASDQALLQLFNELPDETGWNHPKKRMTGGAIQLSREFQTIAKTEPGRAVRLVRMLEPNRHDIYAGAALDGLAESQLPTGEYSSLFEDLIQKGFSSEEFLEKAASGLEKLAHRDKGLADESLSWLELWLSNNPHPTWPADQEENENDKSDKSGEPILFGLGGIFTLPHGRGAIIRAIAAGYLKREPPNINEWIRVISGRINLEKHPKVWVMTLSYMPILYREDRRLATQLYDEVIHSCPEVLNYRFGLYSIARVLGWAEPREHPQEWLLRLEADGSDFCLQAYGELICLYHLVHLDSWSGDRIRRHLIDYSNSPFLRGLAHAAGHFWKEEVFRKIATEIFTALAGHEDESVQRGVAELFRLNRDNPGLILEMRGIIEKVMDNSKLLLKVAPDLIEAMELCIDVAPDLVCQVSQKILEVGVSKLQSPASFLAFYAVTLTNIALTLHRMPVYRQVGLELFENLLSLNLREARVALEILDRKPKQIIFPSLRRRRKQSN